MITEKDKQQQQRRLDRLLARLADNEEEKERLLQEIKNVGDRGKDTKTAVRYTKEEWFNLGVYYWTFGYYCPSCRFIYTKTADHDCPGNSSNQDV